MAGGWAFAQVDGISWMEVVGVVKQQAEAPCNVLYSYQGPFTHEKDANMMV